jgi:uncharacterized glyoxalase superfamily protein PhnB
VLARLIRFEHVCQRMRADPGGWAGVAADAGFCDQSHLNREFRELARTTPAEFLARCLPDGGVVGDHIPDERLPLSKPRGHASSSLRRDPDAKETNMAPPSETTMTQTIYPALRYADPDAALRWLKEALGAEEKALYRDDSGAIHHCELLIEGGLVMMGAAAPDGWLGGESPRAASSTIGLYIVVEDPDAHHARALAVGARIVRAPEDTSYGSREYSLRDPEGNLWSFGTYHPTAT